MRTPQLPKRTTKPRKPRIDRIFKDSTLKITITTITAARGKRLVLRVALMRSRRNRLVQATARLTLMTRMRFPSLEEPRCRFRSQRKTRFSYLRRSQRLWISQSSLKVMSQPNMSMRLQRRRRRNERLALNLIRS
jgi:hypothetical protein